MKKRSCVVWMGVMVVGGWAWAGGGFGTTGADFLRMGAGARGMSMGEGYSALVEDVTGLYWNPGALGTMEKRSITLMHAKMIEESSYDFGAYGQRVGEGGIGGGIQYYSAGKTITRDNNGNETGTSEPNELAVLVGYGRRIGAYSAGATVKYVRSALDDTASTVAMDVGGLTPWYLNGKMRLAATVVNVGGPLKYDKESTDLPMAMRVGVGVKMTKNWLAGMDVVAPRGEGTSLGIGTEYRIGIGETMQLALRGGYNTENRGGSDGVSGGVGFRLKGLEVDYALVTQGDFDASHRVSMAYRF